MLVDDFVDSIVEESKSLNGVVADPFTPVIDV